MRKLCPKCELYIPLYPGDGKCPNCGQGIGLPTMGELEAMSTAIPRPVPLDPIDWLAIFDSLRDSFYLVSVIIALERRRAEKREQSGE